ncbi:MAG: A/G-specific adenine glycosylase [Bacteroidetes bacterium RIFCSPHIGHO2_02_FULL_44_7]|nr:MAG: A/G-specific adenine glycosylase [Bacteroidetes bacterium RIFCSPHIGHO2_02_FULL_44_7]
MSNFSPSITKWYRQNKRNLPWREVNDPYKIWLSEIILQQTRVDQGMSYYQKFVKHYPQVCDLARADEQEVLNDWQGLGYYSRARNLHAAARQICDELHGVFPNNYASIRELKGVGDYTAAAISSFAFGEAKAVVDGNVYRLLSRYFDIDLPIDSTVGKREFQQLADTLLDPANPGGHNQAIMELGAIVCTPKAQCPLCPLNESCIALERNTVAQRPVKSKKTKVRDRYFHFFLYSDGQATYLEKRTQRDIWQHLYQFPLLELENGSFTGLQNNLKSVAHSSDEILHILSHQRIHARFHHFFYLPEQLNENWIKVDLAAIQDYPLPRIIDRYLENKKLNTDIF